MRILPLLVLLLLAMSAFAQGSTTFAGLQWGTNSSTVISTLKSSGIHPSPYGANGGRIDPLCESTKPPTRDYCSLSFDDGPIDRAAPLPKGAISSEVSDAWKSYKQLATVVGTAEFVLGRLVAVKIERDERYAVQREQQLRRRYGAPLSDKTERCGLFDEPCRVLRWRMPSGDSVVFRVDAGWIDYEWSEHNRMLDEALARQKAAEDDKVNRVRY